MFGKKKEFLEEQKNIVVNHYKTCYSVLETAKKTNIAYGQVRRILIEKGIFESFTGENYKKANTKRIKKSTLEKYGVDNISKLNPSGWSTQNHIPYEKMLFDEELGKYRNRVSKLTRKNTKYIKDNTKCFYTRIEFTDNRTKDVNPNDPKKRSVDHRKSVIECFLDGLSPEECAHPSNLVFVLKYVNTIKGNTKEESFIPIAEKIRNRLLNESKESN
jgi:hypothetical protein